MCLRTDSQNWESLLKKNRSTDMFNQQGATRTRKNAVVEAVIASSGPETLQVKPLQLSFIRRERLLALSFCLYLPLPLSVSLSLSFSFFLPNVAWNCFPALSGLFVWHLVILIWKRTKKIIYCRVFRKHVGHRFPETMSCFYRIQMNKIHSNDFRT